ncbi:MAG: hypothetical protein ACXABF_09370 [Candidatus Thorarchaeota archaeon]
MDKNWDDILQEEAEKANLSVSTLLNQIVRKYIMALRFSNHNPHITLDQKTFNEMITSLDEERVSQIGKEMGAFIPESGMLQRGFLLNQESLAWFIEEIYGRYENWYQVNRSKRKKDIMYHLRHDFGRKWSLFLDCYFSSMFNTMLDIDLNTMIRDNSITLYIPISK